MAFRLLVAVLRQFPGMQMSKVKMLPPKTLFPQNMTVRSAGHLIPPSQYDIPMSPKLKIPSVMFKYWETIPLFVTTAAAISIMFGAIFWACKNKVDVVFTTHNRNNISRTMDLRNPTTHKMIIINQRYKPWPELQNTLDRMKEEECNRILRATAN